MWGARDNNAMSKDRGTACVISAGACTLGLSGHGEGENGKERLFLPFFLSSVEILLVTVDESPGASIISTQMCRRS